MNKDDWHVTCIHWLNPIILFNFAADIVTILWYYLFWCFYIKFHDNRISACLAPVRKINFAKYYQKTTFISYIIEDVNICASLKNKIRSYIDFKTYKVHERNLFLVDCFYSQLTCKIFLAYEMKDFSTHLSAIKKKTLRQIHRHMLGTMYFSSLIDIKSTDTYSLRFLNKWHLFKTYLLT